MIGMSVTPTLKYVAAFAVGAVLAPFWAALAGSLLAGGLRALANAGDRT